MIKILKNVYLSISSASYRVMQDQFLWYYEQEIWSRELLYFQSRLYNVETFRITLIVG